VTHIPGDISHDQFGHRHIKSTGVMVLWTALLTDQFLEMRTVWKLQSIVPVRHTS